MTEKKGNSKRVLMLGIVILLALAAIPTVGSITGDGFSWRSLGAYAAASRGADAIAAADEPAIDRSVYFVGSPGPKDGGQMVDRLVLLQTKGITLQSGKARILATGVDDGFLETQFAFEVTVHSEEAYTVECLAAVSEGKIAVIRITQVRPEGEAEALSEEAYPGWVRLLEEAITTYNPG